jgi:Rieske Fe-S protein
VPPVEAPGVCAARRALLLGVGAAGLAALPVLAACGGDGGQGTAAASTATPATPATRSAAAPSEAEPTTDDPFAGIPSDNGPPGGALVATKDVPVGGGVLVQDSKIVVQPRSGTFKAYSATCPHQGVIVPAPSPGASIMECPGHNSQFKAADGSLVRGPATRGLTAIPVKVQKGYVVQA